MLKGDIILIVFLCILIISLFLPSFIKSDEKLRAEIYSEGELIKAVSLSECDGEEYSVSGCTLLMEKDGVTFIEAACPDRLCIKRGKLKRKGDTMACVPQKVVVVIKGEKAEDFHIATY